MVDVDVLEVADGVFQARAKHVSWVPVVDGDKVTLVDTGYPGDRVRVITPLSRIGRSPEPAVDPIGFTVYQIRLRGHLGQLWSDWFDGLAITWDDNGDTLLTGSVADQSALHVLLRKIRDLGMTLVSINRLDGSAEPDQGTREMGED